MKAQEIKIKVIYISPLCGEIETAVQGVICQSGETEQYGNGDTSEWFND